MNTYTSLKTLFQTLTNNTSSANLTWADIFINQYTLEILHKYPYVFSEQFFPNIQTMPSQQFYTLPANLRKLNTVQITVGSVVNNTQSGFSWPVKECPSVGFWNNLNITNNITSDIPQYFIIIDGQIGIYPKPATGYNPITISGQIEPTPMSIADYTTGTIVSVPYALTLTVAPAIGDKTATLSGAFALPTGSYELKFSSGEKRLCTITNGLTALTWTQALTQVATTSLVIRSATDGDIITGSGTSWASYMNGLWIQITTTAGDNLFYKINNVIDTTHLSLFNPYTGSAIAGGSATYLIGQVSLLPQAYQLLPVYRASQLYYTIISKDLERAGSYEKMADILEKTMRVDMGNKTTDPTCQDGDKPMFNPNLYINLTQSGTND